MRVASVAPEPEEVRLQAAVHHALGQLPESYRFSVVLHRFEGMSFAEIAHILETSEEAVKVRAHRGYERLRVLLRGLWEELS